MIAASVSHAVEIVVLVAIGIAAVVSAVPRIARKGTRERPLRPSAESPLKILEELRMVNRLAVLVLALVAFANAASSASAAAPPCTQAQGDPAFYADLAFKDIGSHQPNVPSTVVSGRETPAKVYIGMAAVTGNPEDAPTVSIQAASGAPLSHPFARVYTPQVDDPFQDVPVQLDVPDGPAVINLGITIRAQQTSTTPGPPYCRLSLSSGTITPIPDSVKLVNGSPSIIDRDEQGRTQAVELKFDTTLCSRTISLAVQHAGLLRTLVLPSCKFQGSVKGAGGLRVVAADRGDPSASESEPTRGYAYMFVRRAKRLTRTVRYSVSYETRVIKHGSFRVRSRLNRGYPGHRIYDSDFDNYVNTCINENYRIYAFHGRLYCFVPGQRSYWYQRIDRLR
jgi:hypothetical protein